MTTSKFKLLCLFAFGVCSLLLMDTRVRGEEAGRVEASNVIQADIAKVWAAFTTPELMKQWMAVQVEIDLKVGGKMRTHYDPQGVIGDERTIENTILAFDPQRMLSYRATKFPQGFPFEEAARKTWSVFYFEPVAGGGTKVTMVGLGYTDSPQSQAMKKYFASANGMLFKKLKKLLEESGDSDEK